MDQIKYVWVWVWDEWFYPNNYTHAHGQNPNKGSWYLTFEKKVFCLVIQQSGHYIQVFIFPDFSLTYNLFSWLKSVSGIAKSSIDNFYPLTSYGNKICDVNIF